MIIKELNLDLITKEEYDILLSNLLIYYIKRFRKVKK